ncbi:tyrosine-type recombinase/integrase [Enterobacter hormaechei subsp. xiangfangensis]|uniref:tyrosine-type recombinase/integrase n=1 Tax=Enterobacter TaxID=547 RepID=UPI0005EF4C46|nr:tyrosine-type recombinase/integrase [Enterobacter hormaechei]HBM2440046.1 tyrosine-type recombinase/integrase [Enterobacter hormaechei subsp. xiangfangensis]ELD3408008.1 tyrosine-type recombinase/integrase [Enterobacter hormaechei]KJO65934.1 integrase [Enterobacter hormaechei subsp. steigerwaltii]MCO6027894.1 tyrosine-type recombinase/integrase [Enterobacter hormaechei]MCO7374672.1 tyrosine-type recombinase/integrase [Enterobacter hormaechei]
MGYRTLPYTFQRNGNYYLQIRLSNGRMYKKSLLTDSYREASALMIGVTPHIPFVKSLATPILVFEAFLSNLIASERKAARNPLLPQQQIIIPAEIVETPPPAESEKVLTLSDAWAMYKDEKGRNWTNSISMANERYMEVLLTVLGEKTDVTAITKQDIKQVMEVVENLPKRVVQPYRSMSIQQLIAYDDVPPDDLVGVEAIHKHLKLYKSVFKTFLTESKDILSKPPTDGVVSAPSKARFGAYSAAEMRKFVGWALKQPDGWFKWITLLLAYTGARRGEIAKLEKSQIKFDEDSQRYYFLIAEGGQGKTENATRQVVIHPKLIEWGFMEYVDRQWKERIFSEVAGSNMTKIGKMFTDLRDELGIAYLDDFGQRRLLHSIRHSVCSSAMAGWVKNILHLQQTVGHEKSGGITKRYLHTFPLSSVSYVIDGIDWES